MTVKQPKAVGLLSGGLDSVLAARLMKEIGVEVTLLHFDHIFHHVQKGSGPSMADRIAEELSVPMIKREITEEMIPIVCEPKFGHGKNLNPCIDCRILLLKKAKEEMERIGADFIFTGEVVGQRPMSQNRNSLRQVENRAGVAGILLRPLSAKILPPTPMEESGLIDREQLLDIAGRSRAKQIALAEKWGVRNFNQPAGGCLLTDPVFCERLQRQLELGKIAKNDIELIRFGRHFLLDDQSRIVVGRNQADNDSIKELAREGDRLFFCQTHPGPLVLFRGNPTEENLRTAALLQKRYGKARKEPSVMMTYRIVGEEDLHHIDVSGNIGEEFLDRNIVG